MSVFTYPDYYKNFHCTGSDCTETCCQKWEIDIDQKTLDYWNSIEGPLGEKIRQNVTHMPDGTHCIQMNDSGFCPFLDENRLCSLYTRIGVQHISDICNEHPRFYNWNSHGREAGMGICCEEVAKMVLNDNKMVLCSEEENQPADQYSPDDMQAENFLFEKRGQLQSILQSEYKTDDIFSLLDKMFDMGIDFQDQFYMELSPDYIDDYGHFLLKKENVEKLLDVYMSLEINSDKWTQALSQLKTDISNVLSHSATFFAKFPQVTQQYVSLMWYFIYRYFIQSLDDCDIIGKINFAIVSVITIHILDLQAFASTGDFTFTDQVNIVKLFSQEIEYDTDNMQIISQLFID